MLIKSIQYFTQYRYCRKEVSVSCWCDTSSAILWPKQDQIPIQVAHDGHLLQPLVRATPNPFCKTVCYSKQLLDRKERNQ